MDALEAELEENAMDVEDVPVTAPPQEPVRKKRKSASKVRQTPPNVSDERFAKWQDSVDVFSLFVDKPIAKRKTTAGEGTEEAGRNQFWLTLYNGDAHLELNETSRRRFYVVSQVPKVAKPSSKAGPPVVFTSVHSAFRYGLGITDENLVVQLSAYCTENLTVVVGNAKMVSADGGPPPAGVVIDLKRRRTETNSDVLQRELNNIIRSHEIPPGFANFAMDPTAKIRALVDGTKEEYRAHWHIRIPVQMRDRYQLSHGPISLRGTMGLLTEAEQRSRLLSARFRGKGPVHSEVPLGTGEDTRTYTSDTAFRFICGAISNASPLRSFDHQMPAAAVLSCRQTTPIGDIMTARRIEPYDRSNMLAHPKDAAITNSRTLRYLMARSLGESERRTFFIVHKLRGYNTMAGAGEFNGPQLDSPIERVPLSKLYSEAHFDPLAYMSFHSTLNRFILSVADIFPQTNQPTVQREVVNFLARLGRSFGAYVDGSRTKLWVFGQALALRDFYDALSLNASTVDDPESHAYKVFEFGPSRAQYGLSEISTDVYLNTYRTVVVDEPASISSELVDFNDESSVEMDRPLYKRDDATPYDSRMFDDAYDDAYDDDNNPLFSPDHPADEDSPSRTNQTTPRGKKRPFDALDSRSDDDGSSSSSASVSLDDADIMEIDPPRHTLRSLSPRGFGKLMHIKTPTLANSMNAVMQLMVDHNRRTRRASSEQSNKRAKLENEIRPAPTPPPVAAAPPSHEDEKKPDNDSYEVDFDD